MQRYGVLYNKHSYFHTSAIITGIMISRNVRLTEIGRYKNFSRNIRMQETPWETLVVV